MSDQIKPGLVSVSFRQLSVDEVVDLCAQAKVKGIEWGGDTHVPPGNHKEAQRVQQLCVDCGLDVAAYGSYYRAGVSDSDNFKGVLESAVALQAPSIRIWAGHGPEHYQNSVGGKMKVTEDINRICELASKEGIRICTEKHGGTMTHPDSTHKWLIEHVSHPNFRTLWQPPHNASVQERLQSLELCIPLLENLHVFHWHPRPEDKCSLAEGAPDWQQYFAKAKGHAHYALLEFFIDNSPQQFLKDAETLHQLLAS